MPKEDSRRTIVKKLLEKGKKNGSLSYQEIMDALEAIELQTEQIESIYEALENAGIEITGDKDHTNAEEEADGEQLDDDFEEPDEATLKRDLAAIEAEESTMPTQAPSSSTMLSLHRIRRNMPEEGLPTPARSR